MRNFTKMIVHVFSRGACRCALVAAVLAVLALQAHATDLRRPISPSQPMLLVHIDTWNTPDPQKVIDLIPEDIRPYVVMNISLSVAHNDTTGAWTTIEYGYETAKSWLRTCAKNRMWAMIQPSSGGFSRFPDYTSSVDYDTSLYGRFFKEYPNFLGFNYAEQFWGFDDTWSVSWATRVAHWTNLMSLCDKYGGYLYVSWCGAYYGAGINPIAMMKKNSGFAAMCKKYSQNFLLAEKFTSKYGFLDIESTVMGTWLSGYAGHYGIRFDQCGWSDSSGDGTTAFPVSAGAAPVVEHAMLTGETFMDGPELIWQQCIKNLSNGTTTDGYTTRRWEMYPQYVNISIDVFRKILDGTIRIPTRKEVVDRTKVVILNDVTSGSDTAKYSSPGKLFEGLYKMDGDGDLLSNRTWFKKTGRYPSIPTAYLLADDTASAFSVQVKKSAFATRWSTTAAKQAEFNNLFPQEYTGTIYAGRLENGWVTYNPYKTTATATGSIPLKYNTCDSVDVTYAQFTVGVIKEYAGKLNFYLTNYNNADSTLKTDTIEIYGASSKPTFTYTDRGSHQASTLASGWSNNVFSLYVKHCGPVDLVVTCSGKATGRSTSYTTASLSAPDRPSVYTGPWQYEAENFDVKSIGSNVTSGIGNSVRLYTGMGFLKFGTSSAASIRDTVTVPTAGTYKIAIRYLTSSGDVSTVDLYVNGTKVATPAFKKTANDSAWAVDSQSVSLNAGSNVVMFKANATGTYSVFFDNIVIVGVGTTTGIREDRIPAGHPGPVTYQVYDYSGRKIGTVTGADGQDLSMVVSELSVRPGIYLVRYASNQGLVARRIVVAAP
jgi:hypothetical protein